MKTMGKPDPGSGQPRLSVVTVTWNHRDELEPYITALEETRRDLDFSLEVVIVDNDSADGTADHIEERAQWIRVIRSGRNAGFAEGCNIGLREATGDFLMLLNPDALATAKALGGMTNFLQRHPRVGAIGCLLTHTDGLPQFSAYAPPGPLPYIANQSMIYPVIEKARKKMWSMGFFRGTKPRRCGWLMGSCIIVPRAVWEEVGGFDPSYFMYCEDTDWCHRIAATGRDVVFHPGYTMLHAQKGSSRRAPEWCFRRVYRSNLHFANMHMEGAGKALFRATMMADMLLRIPVYTALSLVMPGRREFLRERVRSVRKMVTIVWSGNPDLYNDPPPGREGT
ncbi:MAG: glycosyltransferase family 2 protein [Candidatus Sumerlaeia bacterium]|nr:glycosyltransferase family 2 protein [Candidatus Sumerlaeia bacterium]